MDMQIYIVPKQKIGRSISLIDGKNPQAVLGEPLKYVSINS